MRLRVRGRSAVCVCVSSKFPVKFSARHVGMDFMNELASAPPHALAVAKGWVAGYRKLCSLPALLRDNAFGTIAAKLATGEPFEVEVPAAHVAEFNGIFDGLKSSLRDYKATPWLAEPARTYAVVATRVVLCVASALGLISWGANLAAFFAVQLLLCPLSAPIVVAFCAAAGPEIVATHVVNYLLGAAYTALMPAVVLDWTVLTLRLEYVGLFFVYDLVLSAVYWRRQAAATRRRCEAGWGTMVYLVWWGVLACSTTVAHAHILALGAPVVVPMLLLDLKFNLSLELSFRLYRCLGLDLDAALYLEHRLAHLPHVYEQTHKNHHVGPPNPFNYLMGVQEFAGMVAIEGVLSNVLGTCPHYFSGRNWLNMPLYKADHIMSESSADAVNDHAYHHTNPNRNFAFCINALDVLHGTHAEGARCPLPSGYELTRTAMPDGTTLKLRFALPDGRKVGSTFKGFF